MRRRTFVGIALAATSLLFAGCSAPALPSLKTSALSTLVTSSHSSTVPLEPIEVYQRIAGRAAKCWFGPDGPLRHSHIFHAIVQSPADGGVVEIGIHKRTSKPKSPWGAKVYAIVLKGTTSTDISFQNFGMDLKTRTGMKNDALAWANGKPACTQNVAPQPAPQASTPGTGASQSRTQRR
jgi:hypothetical protein